MQRYFAIKNSENIILSEDDIFHISKVMRNRPGDKIEIVDNSGKLNICEITNVNPFEFKIINSINEDHENNSRITLFYCLPKGEKLDLVIQKAVELGVYEVVLVNSNRCVRKYNDDFSRKLVRFQSIIKEASEQCKRTRLMILDKVIDIKDLGNYKADLNYIAYEKSNSSLNDLKEELLNSKNKSINIIIGSEGGFDPEEVTLCEKNGYKVISLGKRILRSETSCFYILSLLSFFTEQ